MLKDSKIFLLLFCIAIVACKPPNRDKDDNKSFININAFIRGQIRHVDTSLYAIRRIEFADTTHSDTVFFKREEFKSLAADFLSLPDITSHEFSARYKEDKMFDETMGRVIISYNPLKPENELIQHEEMLVTPDPSGDRITSVIINTVMNNRDSAVEKKMLWQKDKSFQVTTIKQLKGKPETTTTVKVVWDDDEEQQ